MKRFARQTMTIVAGCLAVLLALDTVYTWAISENPVYGIRKNEKVDWLITGDSRSLALRAPYLSYVSGMKVLNVASPFYTLENTKEILELFFNNGNRADRVLLQVDQKFGSRKGVNRNYEYMPHIFRQQGLPLQRFPFKYYAENNRNIRPSNLRQFLKGALNGRHDYETLDTTWVKINHFSTNPKLMVDNSIDEFRIDEIKRIRDYLIGKGVKEVVLYTPPCLPEWTLLQSDSASFKEKVRKAGFAYHDLSNIYSDTAYFIDHLHIKNRKDYEYCRLVSSTVLNAR